jgi:hypothetical protein
MIKENSRAGEKSIPFVVLDVDALKNLAVLAAADLPHNLVVVLITKAERKERVRLRSIDHKRMGGREGKQKTRVLLYPQDKFRPS